MKSLDYSKSLEQISKKRNPNLMKQIFIIIIFVLLYSGATHAQTSIKFFTLKDTVQMGEVYKTKIVIVGGQEMVEKLEDLRPELEFK